MNRSKISYLVISDIHLGHGRIKTEYIVNNLLTLFKEKHNVIKKLDIIFLAGDVYDKLLASSSKEFAIANEWLSMLALYCQKHNIKLRMLEGTPSHDWKQVSLFSTTLKALNIDVEYKYIDHLTIEYMEDLGIYILYIPDEWNSDSKDTIAEVRELMGKMGLAKVDIAIMHGQFKYQLPMIELPSTHVESDYLDIVKYYINIGHIHTSSVYGRIVAQGSFDRLAHNEEEDKGCMVMSIYHTGDMNFTFLKNKGAYPHKKYDLSSYDISEIAAYLHKELSKLKLGTRVKIIIPSNEVNALLGPIKDKHKDLIFTIDKQKPKPAQVIKNNRVEFAAFEITKDNIMDLMLESLSDTAIDKEGLGILKDELESVI